MAYFPKVGGSPAANLFTTPAKKPNHKSNPLKPSESSPKGIGCGAGCGCGCSGFDAPPPPRGSTKGQPIAQSAEAKCGTGCDCGCNTDTSKPSFFAKLFG